MLELRYQRTIFINTSDFVSLQICEKKAVFDIVVSLFLGCCDMPTLSSVGGR